MVQANLEGRKTNTRRLNGLERMNEYPEDWKPYVGDCHIDKKGRLNQKFFNNRGFSDHAICPYGKVGDVIWVRETFAPCTDGIPAFKANYSDETLAHKLNKGMWKPSIHMPKVFSRIWLEIEKVKVERLHDISEEDAMEEGVKYVRRTSGYCFFNYKIGDYTFPSTAKKSFESLWKKINGIESWDANPWVWVIQYKVLSTTGKPQNI